MQNGWVLSGHKTECWHRLCHRPQPLPVPMSSARAPQFSPFEYTGCIDCAYMVVIIQTIHKQWVQRGVNGKAVMKTEL
jgi:hypothetical protein